MLLIQLKKGEKDMAEQEIKKYIINTATGCMHIKDMCRFSQDLTSFVSFDTEQEAVEYGKRSIKTCKICMNQRDR